MTYICTDDIYLHRSHLFKKLNLMRTISTLYVSPVFRHSKSNVLKSTSYLDMERILRKIVLIRSAVTFTKPPGH